MQRRELLLAGGLAALVPAARADEDQIWIDSARGRELPLRLRWPEGSAPCALIVHSHGLGGNREGGDRWGRAWQAAGFAVLHLQHPGSDIETLRSGAVVAGMGAIRAAASAEQLRARVADVQFAIGEVLRRAARGDAPWTRVRRDAIGASGHSFGAHTMQALAGQRALLWIEGADHATFGGNTQTRRRAARLMRRHPVAERDEAQHQERIARATTDWWRAMLLGDAAALRSLREQVRMD